MTDWEMIGKPALVILHMQEGIVGNRRMFPGKDKDIELAGVLPHQQALLKAFRDRELPIVYVNALPNPIGILPAYGFHFRKVYAQRQWIPGTTAAVTFIQFLLKEMHFQ